MLKSVVHTYRQSFSGLSTNIWGLSLVLLINRSGTMVVPFITIYLTQHLHYSLVKATLVNAVFGIGAIAGAVLGGKLTDKIGFTSVQLAALIGGGVLFIILGYIENFYGICIISFLLSLVNDAFRPANSAAIAAYSLPQNRTRSYSLNRLAVNLGWALGASAGGILAGINYKLLFWVDGITNLGAAIILWFIFYRNKPVNEITETTEKTIAPGSPWKDWIYIKFIIIVTLFASCFMLTFRIIPVYYKEVLLLPEAWIGLILGLNGIIIAFFEMVIVSRLEGRRNPVVYIRWGLYLGGVTFISLFLPGPALLIAIVSIVFFTFSEILAMPFMNTYWIGRSNDYNRGSYAAVYTIAWSVAQIVGPYLGALVVDHYSYSTLWIAALIVSCGCALSLFTIYDRKLNPIATQEI